MLEPFYGRTLAIQSSKRPTIHQTFHFWNYLFNKIDDMKDKLRRSRLQWKRELAESLDLMSEKMKEYYTYTGGPGVYVDSVILSPNMKRKFFEDENWESTFADRYVNESHERFRERYSDLHLDSSSTEKAAHAKPSPGKGVKHK